MTSTITRTQSNSAAATHTLAIIKNKRVEKTMHLFLKMTLGAPLVVVGSILFLPYDIATYSKRFKIEDINRQIESTNVSINSLTSPSKISDLRASQRNIDQLLRKIQKKENERTESDLLRLSEQLKEDVDDTQVNQFTLQVEKKDAEIDKLNAQLKEAISKHAKITAPVKLPNSTQKKLNDLREQLKKLNEAKNKWYTLRKTPIRCEKMFTYLGVLRNIVQLDHLKKLEENAKLSGEAPPLNQEIGGVLEDYEKSQLPIRLQIRKLKETSRSFSPVRGKVGKD